MPGRTELRPEGTIIGQRIPLLYLKGITPGLRVPVPDMRVPVVGSDYNGHSRPEMAQFMLEGRINACPVPSQI